MGYFYEQDKFSLFIKYEMGIDYQRRLIPFMNEPRDIPSLLEKRESNLPAQDSNLGLSTCTIFLLLAAFLWGQHPIVAFTGSLSFSLLSYMFYIHRP